MDKQEFWDIVAEISRRYYTSGGSYDYHVNKYFGDRLDDKAIYYSNNAAIVMSYKEALIQYVMVKQSISHNAALTHLLSSDTYRCLIPSCVLDWHNIDAVIADYDNDQCKTI
ncbi:hypothetical protein [Serpentinicella alkaliphila]|uniref:Uncharacterized protein n=1 Tax=Serpentinicella alkaliphila TaxID=1734049 RepID=A0A4R2TZR6_9FIRM|nr:hypothetical protein [Serpentinicella alkaliphila]QUH25205.1 hypothetical protein HZR23_05135 [Serpentinicella alkaliphila]TCQ07015.1 hypothetical protein EDD79_100211 [Serpentinicella alkaliphila]